MSSRESRGEGMKAHASKDRRTVSPARLAAFGVLRRVEEEDAYAAPLLASIDADIRADDRALCYELVLGTLRWQLWLDSLINHYAGRSPADLDPPVRSALRLGLYQLRILSRIPTSAAVNESVNLVHLSRLRSAAAFVNAVLRRAAREPDFDPAAAISDPLLHLEIETSHRAWMLQRWIAQFGMEEAEQFARANNQAPPVSFRVTSRSDEEDAVLNDIRQAGIEISPSLIAPGGWRIHGSSARLQQMASEGRIYIQDEASQVVAHVVSARDGERVLDVCAAPGSKTTHIAALAPNLAILVAGDVHENRARTVADSVHRVRVKRVAVVVHDAEHVLPYQEETFDRVVIDAPCSGTGTLRHNPEIRWRITETDIRDLSARQTRILTSAARMVRKGGRLIYSTCSVENEENEEVTARFLKENRGFAESPFSEQIGSRLEVPLDASAVRTWPHKGGADGFYIASFKRLG